MATEEMTPQNTDTEAGTRRGFFSNTQASEEATGPLSNAVNLTTAGFLLSVVGIVYQLIEGR